MTDPTPPSLQGSTVEVNVAEMLHGILDAIWTMGIAMEMVGLPRALLAKGMRNCIDDQGRKPETSHPSRRLPLQMLAARFEEPDEESHKMTAIPGGKTPAADNEGDPA